MSDKVQVELVAKTDGVSSLNNAILSHVDRVKQANKEYVVLSDRTGAAKSSFEKLAGSVSFTRQQMLTLQYTASDVVASVASGISPMTILLQQGGQVAQVFGGASLKIMGIGAAVGIAAYALYDFVSSANEAEGAINNLSTAFEALGKGGKSSKFIVQENIELLKSFDSISEDTAGTIENRFVRSVGISASTIRDASIVLEDFSTLIGVDADEGSKILVRSLEDLSSGAEKLQRLLNYKMNPAVVQAAKDLAESGEHMQAQQMILSELANVVDGVTESSLSPFGQKWKDIKETLSGVGDLIGDAYRAMSIWNDGPEQNFSLREGGEKRLAMEEQRNLALEIAMEDANTNAKKAEESRKEQDRLKNAATEHKKYVAEQNSSLMDQAELESERFRTKIFEAKFASSAVNSSIQKEYDDLRKIKDDEHSVEMAFYDKRQSLYAKDSIEYKKIENDKLRAQEKFKQESISLETERENRLKQQYTKDYQAWRTDMTHRQQTWKSWTGSLQSSFSSALSGMVKGTATVGESLINILGAAIDTIISKIVEMGFEWAAESIFGIASSATLAAADISAASGRAFANTYASISAIPVVGPELAPAAAAAAGAATKAGGMALLSVPSAAGGWEVTKDTLAMVHKDEKILPAETSKKIDNMTSGGGRGQTTFNINALDGKSVERFLAQNGHKIARQVARSARNSRGVAIKR